MLIENPAAMTPRVRIERALERLRDRMTRFTVATALVRSLASLALAAVVGVLVLSVWPVEAVRRAVLLAAALAFLAPWVVLVSPRLRRERSDLALAARLEAHLPALRSDVRAALELSARPDPEGLAGALRDALVARVADTIDDLGSRVDDAVPRPRVHGAVRTILGAAAFALLASLVAPTAFVPRLLAGIPRDGGDPSARRDLAVAALDLRLTAPAYTGLGTRSVPRVTGTVPMLTGTRVALNALALVDASSATLRLETASGQEEIALDISPLGLLQGQFIAREDARLVFTLQTEAGAVVDSVERRIAVQPDAPPAVELLEPTSDREVTAGQIVNVEYRASDDYGLTSVALVWHFAGDERNQREMPLQERGVTNPVEEHVPFDLEPLALQPREEVVLWIEARDSNDIDGPSVGRSRAVHLRVAAPEDRHAEVLDAKLALFESLLERLAELLPHRLAVDVAPNERGRRDRSAPSTPKPARLELADRVERLTRAQGELEAWGATLTLFRGLLAMMADDELTVLRDQELLQGTLDRLNEAERNWARALDAATPPLRQGQVPDPVFDAAALAWTQLVDATERATLLLDDLVASHRADDVERTLAEIASLRENLRDLLQQWRDTRDPDVREAIERELRRLEARMRELLERLASQVDNLPAEHMNAEALQPSELQESVGEMASALDMLREMLDADDIEGAIQALDDLAASLEQMGSQMDRATSGGSGSEGLSEFDRAMAELVDEVNALEEQERTIASETEALDAQMRARREEELREQTRELLDRAREQLAVWEEKVDRTGTEHLPSRVDAALRTTREQVERLADALEAGDAAEAADRADQLVSRFADMDDLLRSEMSTLYRDRAALDQASRMRDRMGEGGDMADRIGRQMQRLMEQGEPVPTPGEQAQLGELAQRQRGVQQQLQQLGERADAMGERFPMPGELGEALRQAGESMGEASNELGGRRPRPALRSQQRAIESLQSARQQMQQMMQRQRRQQQSGRDMSQERVEIPEGSEPRNTQFRREVMDAMREGTLESWEDPIRRYYDGLVR